MEIKVLPNLPYEYNKPIKTYETRFVYVGFSKYDAERRVLSKMIEKDGKIYLTEYTDVPNVFPRAYHTELVRVNVYSENPRVWSEELSPWEIYFFKQEKQVD